MTDSSDVLQGRRAVVRHVSAWRALALVSVVLCFLLLSFCLGEDDFSIGGLASGRGHVARLSVVGTIELDKERSRLIREIAEDGSVRALILSIDSPGGTVAGSESLFLDIMGLAKKKPVVAVMGNVAASGGYLVSLAADHVVALQNTITGSVGVIFQWPQVDEMLEEWKIRVPSVRSGPLKAYPDPFSALPDEARRDVERLVEKTHAWFLGLVDERRGVSGTVIRSIAKGGVYRGEEAVRMNLIDEVGDENAALEWLASVHGLPSDIEVRDWEGSSHRLEGALDYVSAMLGLEDFLPWRMLARAGRRPSGLLVLWEDLS